MIRSGVYKCIATNSEGDDSKEFKIELNSEPAFEESPAEIIIAPNDKQQMKLSCAAGGKPKPSIKWFKNGVEMTDLKDQYQITVNTNKQKEQV